VSFDIIVVDDDSSDATAEIARSFAEVEVVAAGPLPKGWGGKSNALATGAKHAKGKWLLFTDADTVHRPGSLARAVEEAEHFGAALLSYSPRQEVVSFWEQALMPVVFAELAATYRPSDVCDPAKSTAAANGQYLLIAREAYDAVGGHAAVAGSLLEDVELARAVKRSGRGLRFRFGGDAVSTRMYRTFPQMREGWTKNLALLFPHPTKLAAMRALEFSLIAGGAAVAVGAVLGSGRRKPARAVAAGVLSAAAYAIFLGRIRKAHFGRQAEAASIFGLPLFSFLLLRSANAYRAGGEVAWKGRSYKAASGQD
jgi:glycosyltransferase involved in cell wall biosynthesis